MPRKKKELLEDVTPNQPEITASPETESQQTQFETTFEELAQPVTEPKPEQRQSFGTTPEAQPVVEPTTECFLAASLESATASIEQLFTTQAELSGSQVADQIFDRFEEAFTARLEQRLQPFVDTVLPAVRKTSAELKQGSTARLQRRLGLSERLKQIAQLVSDECRLLPPIHAVGEFISWDEVSPNQLPESKENDQ